MPDLDTHRRNIATALQSLEKSLDRLVDALAHRPAWLAVDGATDDHAALRHVCEAYRKIDYDMEDEVNETLDCLGVVGVSSEVLARADQVNETKAELKRVCLPLSRLRTRVPRKATKDAPGGEAMEKGKGEGADTEMIQTTRAVLRSLQRSDLNLTAAYRKIPILGAPPRMVTYVRASTRAVYRKTVAELETLLMAAEGPNASKDRARLAALSPRETHLALVQEHYTNIRANVVYDRLDARGRGRVQVVAELPLLYAHGRHPKPPDVHFPATEPDPTGPTARRARQSRLEPVPYLQSLPVYRYAPSH
jgi:hypothetical protein